MLVRYLLSFRQTYKQFHNESNISGDKDGSYDFMNSGKSPRTIAALVTLWGCSIA